MRFWIVEGSQLVRYKRTGKCRKCGQCCKGKLVSFSWDVRTAGPDSDDLEMPEEDWSDHAGFSIFWAQGTWWYFKAEYKKPRRCSALSEAGLCDIWMDEGEFHPICRYWPFHPSALDEFPNCGFHFERD